VAPLKAALDEAAKVKRSPVVLLNSEGQPWTHDGFRASWGKARDKAGIIGVTFNDLRGTAVTRLALVGCTEAQIASLTGHSLRDVTSILDAHYLHRDPQLARDAIHKLEMGYAKDVAEPKTGTDSSKRPSKCPKRSTQNGGKALRYQVAGEPGFEPRLTESEAVGDGFRSEWGAKTYAAL
jgi:hypothetical protein